MNWLRKFMTGRYGVDQLSTGLISVSLILLLINIFLKNQIISSISMIILLLSYFRIFSRNINKRYQENMQYLNATKPLREKTYKIRNRFSSLKTHKYYKCPECSKELRVPKGKGKIAIKCPKCGNKFTRRT